jgi:Uncharacterized conserved protein
MLIALIVLLAIILLIVLWTIGVYNKLVKLKVLMKEAWSIVDVFLNKRYDLIPNLVETVRGYAEHESETFENVILARSQAMGAKNIGDKIESEGMLGSVLGRLMAISESYPQLRANENFMHLQAELASLEDEIEKARRYYNGTVRENNIYVNSFPSNIIAGVFNFPEGTFFEGEERKREAPKVSFKKE